MADASYDLHLHPLVLINVCDHVTRFKSAEQKERVMGAVIGQQESRRVDMHNSFEMLTVVDAEGVELPKPPEDPDERERPLGVSHGIDLDFFKERTGQYNEVFPRYEFLGWYSSGTKPDEADKALHKKIQEITGNDNPFLLLLDTDKMAADKASQSEELPVKVFEAVPQIVQGQSTVMWREVPYIIDTVEAERISVNNVAKAATTSSAGHHSDFTQHAGSLETSVLMLSKRVKELLEHVKEVKAGRVQKNHDVMRELLSICQALKASHPEALQRQYCDEFNDAALVVLMASLTKACAGTSDLLDKFQVAFDKKHRQRHHYPFG